MSLVHGDAKLLLPQLVRPLNIASWQAKVRVLKREYGWNYHHIGETIYAPALLKQISERMHVDTIVTKDVGQHHMWTA